MKIPNLNSILADGYKIEVHALDGFSGMKKSLLWILMNALAVILAVLCRSNLFLSKGSDALVSVYRVSFNGLIAALLLFAIGTAVFIFKPHLQFRLPFNPRWIDFVGLLCIPPLLLCYHTVTIGAKENIAEVKEYLGPIEVRHFKASDAESLIPAICSERMLTLGSEPILTQKIYLGLWLWSLPGSICEHPFIQSQGFLKLR